MTAAGTRNVIAVTMQPDPEIKASSNADVGSLGAITLTIGATKFYLDYAKAVDIVDALAGVLAEIEMAAKDSEPIPL